NDTGARFRRGVGRQAMGERWYSFDPKGAHFIGLVNVMNLKAGGLGNLGSEQLEWLEKDVAKLKSSTPVVVFAHIPLWAVYPQWGWGTDDSEQALSYLKRFGSVTVLNGHIHQTMQKIEGNITFHTAMSTAFPQPKPGAAPSPGPMKVPAEKLRGLLGLTGVYYVENKHSLAVIDSPLLGMGESSPENRQENKQKEKNQPVGANEVSIDNFSFSPKELTVAHGTKVRWTNHDDIPHTVVAIEKQFTSYVLDTDQSFSFMFTTPGIYEYYCSIHTHMVGKIIVK